MVLYFFFQPATPSNGRENSYKLAFNAHFEYSILRMNITAAAALKKTMGILNVYTVDIAFVIVSYTVLTTI